MRVVFLILGAVALVSCQKKLTMDHSSWEATNRFKSPPSFAAKQWQSKERISTTKFGVEFKRQLIGNIPVEGTFAKIVENKKGAVTYVEQYKLKTSPSLDTRWASTIAVQSPKAASVITSLKSRYDALKDFKIEKPELNFVFDDEILQLVWKALAFDKEGLGWIIESNLDLSKYEMLRAGSSFHETTASVFPQGPKLSSLQDVVIRDLSTIEDLVSPRLSLTTATVHRIKDSEDSLRFDPSDERFDQVQVFYTVTKALDWFREKIGVSLTNPLEVQVHVGYPDKTNTAFYYRNRIRLGAGDGITYDRIPMDPSIVTHETGHAIVEALTQLPYENEGGSLNEALADFFTAIQTDNPNMGEVAYLKAPFRRTVANSEAWTQKNGGLYHDSAIISGLLWNMKKQFGVDRSLDLVLKTLARVTPSTDFEDFQIKLYLILKAELSGEDRVKMAKILREREWPEL